MAVLLSAFTLQAAQVSQITRQGTLPIYNPAQTLPPHTSLLTHSCTHRPQHLATTPLRSILQGTYRNTHTYSLSACPTPLPPQRVRRSRSSSPLPTTPSCPSTVTSPSGRFSSRTCWRTLAPTAKSRFPFPMYVALVATFPDESRLTVYRSTRLS